MFTMRQRRSNDRGMTLIEVLVAIALLAIVGTIVSGIIISALKITRTTTSGVEGQSELNDAVTRITRDIAASDPILWTSTTNGWAKNTPAVDDLWVQSTLNGRCVRTRYYVETSGSTKSLKSDVRTYPTSACPDPRLVDTGGTTTTKTIVKSLKTTANDNVTQLPVFTYLDQNNQVIPAPVSRANVDRIARVKIDIGSNVRERAQGVRLATSVAPRSMDSPLVTGGPNIPLPDCLEANLNVISDGGRPSSPVVRWSSAVNTDRYTLSRATPDPYMWTAATGPGTITDTAMRGRHGVTIQYALTLEGPGGVVDCILLHTVPALGPLTPPVLSASVNPDTSSSPQPVPASTVSLSWPAVLDATAYQIYRRPIDRNVAPYNATGLASWGSPIATTTSTSYSQNPGFDQAFEYYVVAISTDYLPTRSSSPSNSAKALTHTDAPTLSASPLTYRQNRITWIGSGSATADGYNLFRRPTGSSNWTSIAANLSLSTLSFTDTTAELSSRYDYMVTSFNIGPRGTRYPGSQSYFGEPSNVVSVLQFPDYPQVNATGTEVSSNPDGQNTASWPTVPTATSYRLIESATPTGAAAATTTVTSTSAPDTGHARGTRNYYAVAACNATGCSENLNDVTLRATRGDWAYQRPADLAVTVGNATADSCPDVAESATNAVFNCDTRTAVEKFVPNADAGEPTDKFCGGANEGACRYVPVVAGAQGAALTGVPANPVLNLSHTTSQWGQTLPVGVLACNQGGCSNIVPTNVRAYPGPFSKGPHYTTQESNFSGWWANNGGFNETRREAQANVNWTNSAGVRPTNPYQAVRTVHANDRLNKTFDLLLGTTTTGERAVSPGAAYRYTISAFAANSLRRSFTFTLQAPPGKPGFIQGTSFCNSAVAVVHTASNTSAAMNTWGWKGGYKFRLGAFDNSGTNSYVDRFEMIEYAARLGANRFNNGENWFSDTLGVAGLGTGAWLGKRATQWVVGDRMWVNTGLANSQPANSGGMTPLRAIGPTSFNATSELVSNLTGSGAATQVRGVINRSGTHNTDYGDFMSGYTGIAEYKGADQTYPCGTGWNARPTAISRRAHKMSPGHLNPYPNPDMNDWNQNG